MADFGLDPVAVQYYDSARSRLKRTYQYGAAQQALTRGIGATQYGWRRGDLTRQFAQQRERFGQPYASRGLFRSGIYKSALGDFHSDQARALNRLSITRGWERTNNQTEKSNLAGAYYEGVSDLDAQKRARQEALASMLNGYSA
jgi:hypothetical protein